MSCDATAPRDGIVPVACSRPGCSCRRRSRRVRTRGSVRRLCATPARDGHAAEIRVRLRQVPVVHSPGRSTATPPTRSRSAGTLRTRLRTPRRSLDTRHVFATLSARVRRLRSVHPGLRRRGGWVEPVDLGVQVSEESVAPRWLRRPIAYPKNMLGAFRHGLDHQLLRLGHSCSKPSLPSRERMAPGFRPNWSASTS